MIDVFADDAETTSRGPVTFAAARDPGRCGPMFSPVKVNLLFAESDNDGSFPGVPFGNMGRNHVGYGVDRPAAAQDKSEQRQGAHLPDPICDSLLVRQTLHQMVRLFLLLIVLALMVGCASEEHVFTHTDHSDPVPGEATPAPQSGPHGGWAW
jgi:hypothetical protein